MTTRIPRLFHKPLLFMALMFGLIAVAMAYSSSRTLDRKLTDEYESKAVALATSMAESDINAILDRDASAVQARIDRYMDIDGVAYVLVTDENGRVIAHTFTPVVPEVVENLVREVWRQDQGQRIIRDLTSSSGRHILHVSRHILSGLAGMVHIGMDKTPIRDQIRATLVQQLGMTLLIFLGGTFIAYVFFLNLSRPLAVLTEYARRVAGHDFSHDLEVTARDEIGDLGRSMKSMAADIADLVLTLEERVYDKTLQLQEAKDELELKVEERTAELLRTNTQLKIEIAERRVIGEALRKAEQKYRTIFENAVEGIYQMSPSGRYISANPALARLFGYTTPDELMGAVYDSRTQLYMDRERRNKFLARLSKQGEVKNFESKVRRKDGKLIWVSESARRVDDKDGHIIYYEGSVEDVTLRKKAEEQLKRQAFHDSLTKLPNRALFHDHLRMAIERGKRRDYQFAVLYLDLDRFKVINDSLGHDIGDELLKAVARVLKRCARSMDTVARFGGDEFAILLEEVAAPRDVIRIAKRILEGIRQPFNLNGNEVFSSASIGIVLHTQGYERPGALMRDADMAMYRAKEQGKSRFKVFNHKMHDQVLRLMEMENDLRHAIDQRELTVAYQPIVHLESRRISGFEALVRWQHRERGLISPGDFIPLAEDTGLIYPIDYRVMEEACRSLCRWQRKFRTNGDPPLTLNFNISGKHFGRAQLLRQVSDLLSSTGIDPACLNIELTESALVAHSAMAEELLMQLKGLGVNICIDDFGTGYSSLSYLQKFPIDVVKVDRTFVSRVQDDKDSRAIVSTIFSLGDSMDLKVVAEGVESPEQLSFLEQAGCNYVQGYLFYRPMFADEVEAVLEHVSCSCRN
ncbi:EAL domain-containing protein [Salidesulfovibrio onnuriiensis]|uniref:EAL domain-containing protein n=1 Tax=Salidesulfovibrio onnuriiensis TaxID=2583823 RepID=UPI0011CBC816|nr:EAL domain-containing protein [Salidesulfovibrio onnuriiensis]